jgi:hypothetical protein
MLYIYGDSHAHACFKKINIPYTDYHQNAITMFRIGRDNKIINFNNNEHDINSVICFVYGEIDCRCHIQRQINLGKNEDLIINELVQNYFNTLKNNIYNHKKVIIVGIIPPTRQIDYESVHGPITHAFPFVGTDEERVRYTTKANVLIEKLCYSNGYIYFNPYEYYTRDDGTLKFELSDNNVHIGDNTVVLEKFMDLYNTL